MVGARAAIGRHKKQGVNQLGLGVGAAKPVVVQSLADNQQVARVGPAFVRPLHKIAQGQRVVADAVAELFVEFVDLDHGHLKPAAGRAAPVVGVGRHLVGAVVFRIGKQSGIRQNDVVGVEVAVVAKLDWLEVLHLANAGSRVCDYNMADAGGGGQDRFDQAVLQDGFQAQFVCQVVQYRDAADGVEGLNFQVLRLAGAVQFKRRSIGVFKIKKARVAKENAGDSVAVVRVQGRLQAHGIVRQQFGGRYGQLVLNELPAGKLVFHELFAVKTQGLLVAAQAAGVPNGQARIRPGGGKFAGREVHGKIAGRVRGKALSIEPGIHDFAADLAFETGVGVVVTHFRPAKRLHRRRVAEVVRSWDIAQGLAAVVPAQVICAGIVEQAVPGVQVFGVGLGKQVPVEGIAVALAVEFQVVLDLKQAVGADKQRLLLAVTVQPDVAGRYRSQREARGSQGLVRNPVQAIVGQADFKIGFGKIDPLVAVERICSVPDLRLEGSCEKKAGPKEGFFHIIQVC